MKATDFIKLNEWGKEPTEEELRRMAADTDPGYRCSTRVNPGTVVMTNPPTIACDDAGNPIMPPRSTGIIGHAPSPEGGKDLRPIRPGPEGGKKPWPEYEPAVPLPGQKKPWPKEGGIHKWDGMENPIHLYKKPDPRFKGMEIPKYKHKDPDPRLLKQFKGMEKIKKAYGERVELTKLRELAGSVNEEGCGPGTGVKCPPSIEGSGKRETKPFTNAEFWANKKRQDQEAKDLWDKKAKPEKKKWWESAELTKLQELAGVSTITEIVEPHLGQDDGIDGHPLELLEKVAKQFAEDVANGDYTSIDELLKHVPQDKLIGFLSDI